MSVRKQESFMRGALMLSLAALVSRLLGAFYKPIIARIFAPYDGMNGAVGIGLTQVPLSVYQVIFSFTSVGLNVGISKLVSERIALGDMRGARRAFRLARTVMTALGLVSGLALWFGAPYLAGLIADEAVDTIPGFMAMAPALLFASLMAAYRGLFQGFQLMSPSANSQMIEQLVRVGSGLLLTYILVQESVPLGAAGFNLGDMVGAIAGLVYLLLLARRAGPGLWTKPQEAAATENPAARPASETASQLLRRIFAVAGPITVVGAVVPFMMLADTFFVFRGLRGIGIHGDEAQAQYGLLTNAFTIVYLPPIVTSAIYTSVLPAISDAMALGRRGEARARAVQGYRMTALLAFPAQAGLWVLATGIYALIFGDMAGGPVMAAMAWATLGIMFQQTSSGVLQGMGHIGLPVRNFVVGLVVKVVLTAVWTPVLGINGAAFATALGFLVAALLNLYYVERLLGKTLHIAGMVIKPAVAALAMVAVIVGAEMWLPWDSHLETLFLVGVGGLVYGLVLLLMGGVTAQEIAGFPKVGRPLAALLKRTRLLR